MSDVVPISEAKANLSKLVMRARAGEVMSAPGFVYDADDLIGPYSQLDAELHSALDRDETSSR